MLHSRQHQHSGKPQVREYVPGRSLSCEMINTISWRLGYIAEHVREVYDTKIEVVMPAIQLG